MCFSYDFFNRIPYVPASATGAKAIIVFDEKMSKAPLEQQNKSYPWRVVRCSSSVASVRVLCFSYQDWSGEKQGHPKLPGWKLQHGRWKNPMMIGFPIRNELSISSLRGIKLAAVKGGLTDFTLSRFPSSLKDTNSWNLCGCLLLSCYRQAMHWVVSHRLVWFRRRLGVGFPSVYRQSCGRSAI